jgi:DNA modification methylase
MNRTSLPIHEIIVLDRQRVDYGDISDLANSIVRYGLIQPVIVNQEKRLIAGGRRLAAHQHLNRSHIDVVFRETLSVDELHELELEENVRRKEMSWMERCLNIAKIHQLKQRRAALDREKWGLRETGEMIGLAASRVQYTLELASKLQEDLKLPEDKRRYWQCATFQDAWRLRMRDEEDLVAADMAKETAQVLHVKTTDIAPLDDLIEVKVPDTFTAPSAGDVSHAVTDSDILDRQRRDAEDYNRLVQRIREKGFSSLSEYEAEDFWRIMPERPEGTFNDWYQRRKAQIEPWLTIPLSSMIHKGSCISWMNANPESVDHIITDPPYGIDMDMLNQTNGSVKDIDTVEAEHTVDGNESLFVKLFPAAFNVLKPNGYFILWADQMQWQNLYDLAIAAGFKVQRWPITWVKTHRCINQAIQFNFTKTTEIAMVCRKNNATLIANPDCCHILEPHDDFKEKLAHPFVKPFNVWKFLIDSVSIEGQTILEPFAGRGSGVLSLLRLKRKLIACEINDAHYNALIENVKQHYLAINPNYQFR